MSTTKETIYGNNLAGIYYADYIYGDSGEGTLEVERIVGTDDAGLIDTETEQITARHKLSKLVLIRDRV